MGSLPYYARLPMVGRLIHNIFYVYPLCVHCERPIWYHINERCLIDITKYSIGNEAFAITIEDFPGGGVCSMFYQDGSWHDDTGLHYEEEHDDEVFWAHYLIMKGHKW